MADNSTFDGGSGPASDAPTDPASHPASAAGGATAGGSASGAAGDAYAAGPSTSGTASGASAGGGNSARFFGWIRDLGIVRQNGWIGGVCGGIAARFGIDPIIVRGIAVVVAVLGGPAFLLYAAAWLLLPDAYGDIHLERLIRGSFSPAMIGIIVLAILAFIPFSQGFWWAPFWGGLSWLGSLGKTLWTLALIGGIVWVIVWAVRSGRIPQSTRGGSSSAPFPGAAGFTATGAGAGASTGAPASTGPASTSGWGSANGSADTTGSAGAGAAGPAPASDAYADWRARQDAWRSDYAAWSARQADARTVRQQRSAELRSQQRATAAESEAARRWRRAANPRTSAPFVGVALGAALIVGGVAGIVSPFGASLVVGLAAATLTLGLSIVVAGMARRRSGFLSFVSIVLLIATLAAVAAPNVHQLTLTVTGLVTR
jgi:phage shock protein PspC (stress-responsive transcriptional regulator)